MISGRLSALWQMARAEGDGDALFFSRRITISGDTEAVLALRNAMDDMDTDMLDEILESLGPLRAPARAALGLCGSVHRRMLGSVNHVRDALTAPLREENAALRRRVEALEKAQIPRKKKAAI